jgi:GT2 family glycosyltransferase
LGDADVTGTTHLADRGDASSLKAAFGIATVGRAQTLLRTVRLLGLQSRSPDAIFICAPAASDVAGVADGFPHCRIILGPNGLTRQRNAILDAAKDEADVVIFIDDDFLLDRTYLSATLAVFADNPDVVMTTGHVVRDGIRGPGLDFDVAAAELEESYDKPLPSGELRDVDNGYGCNMAVRLAAATANNIRFDEALPLYGWLEDIDFSRRLGKYGRVVSVPEAKGIHLGLKAGRQSGVRLGYSQIANPFYLARKGTCSWRRALYLISRNMAANLRGLANPEPYVDRAGRVTGNLKAIADLSAGRLSPMRILSL